MKEKQRHIAVCPSCQELVFCEGYIGMRYLIKCPSCGYTGIILLKRGKKELKKVEIQELEENKVNFNKYFQKMRKYFPINHFFLLVQLIGIGLIIGGISLLFASALINLKSGFTLIFLQNLKSGFTVIFIGYFLLFMISEIRSHTHFNNEDLRKASNLVLTINLFIPAIICIGIILWTIAVFFITNQILTKPEPSGDPVGDLEKLLRYFETSFGIFFICVFLGIIGVKELTDRFTSIHFKKRMNIFIFVMLIGTIIVIAHQVIILNGPYTLTLTKSGTGTGTIEVSPSGPYYFGARVTVWANATNGSTFIRFSGALNGSHSPQELWNMNSSMSVLVEFENLLTLTKIGAGNGSIEVRPAGKYYRFGDVVTVWANATNGSTFTRFSGDLNGSDSPKTLVMNGSKTVYARFTLNGPYKLTLTTSGTGKGSIKAIPSGPYYFGDIVTIWANAAYGSTFTRFSGDLNGSDSPKTLVMNGSKAVNAEFT
jgi:hypothetical protein